MKETNWEGKVKRRKSKVKENQREGKNDDMKGWKYKGKDK